MAPRQQGSGLRNAPGEGVAGRVGGVWTVRPGRVHHGPMEHQTSREHALDLAEGNLKEAQRLLDRAKAAHAVGDIDDVRLASLQRLYDTAVEDIQRVRKEN